MNPSQIFLELQAHFKPADPYGFFSKPLNHLISVAAGPPISRGFDQRIEQVWSENQLAKRPRYSEFLAEPCVQAHFFQKISKEFWSSIRLISDYAGSFPPG